MVSSGEGGSLEMASSQVTHQDNVNNNHVRGLSLYELLRAEKAQIEAEKQKEEQELEKQFQQEKSQLEPEPKEKQKSENKLSEKQHRDKQHPDKKHQEKQHPEKKHQEKQTLDKKPYGKKSLEEHHFDKNKPHQQHAEKQLEKKGPEKASASQRSTREKSGAQQKLEQLLNHTGNRHCADCSSPDPKWVSQCAGVFICIKCSGAHRSLGVHITKVLSVNLDEWTEEQVNALEEMGGNILANKKYEACIPVNIKKPKQDSGIEERLDFIRRKYEHQQFFLTEENMSCPFPRPVNTSSYQTQSGKNSVMAVDKKHIDKQASSLRIYGLSNPFRNSWKRKDDSKAGCKKCDLTPGMVEFVGLIKVNVVRGTNLAIRDMVSSDPYVILSLGGQSVKTRVIKNNLNPVWNEKLMLSIPDCVPPLKLLVYDKDTFTTDDFMGKAEIDIQPLVSAAQACERHSIDGSTHLGKWLATKDNTLVKDSIISLKDGTIRQEMSIKLQNVERGVLDLELECVPLSQ